MKIKNIKKLKKPSFKNQIEFRSYTPLSIKDMKDMEREFKHRFDGGTGITKNSQTNNDCDLDYKKIAQSVDAFGDASIWMEDGVNELHSHYSVFDLGVFWEFHKRLHMNYY